MSSESNDKEVQRGKRRTARYTELVLVTLMGCSLFEVPNAFEIFKVVLIPALAYSAALRGLDAAYK